MRVVGAAYRAHDPRGSYSPLSGAGAAIHGGRFNPKGVPALYLALDILTAIREAQQGLPRKIDPLVLCSYQIDCEGVVDLTSADALHDLSINPAELAGGWLLWAQAGNTPSSWAIAKRLIANGAAGVIVPSFAPGAAATDRNLVLWRWGPDLPQAEKGVWRLSLYSPRLRSTARLAAAGSAHANRDARDGPTIAERAGIGCAVTEFQAAVRAPPALDLGSQTKMGTRAPGAIG